MQLSLWRKVVSCAFHLVHVNSIRDIRHVQIGLLVPSHWKDSSGGGSVRRNARQMTNLCVQDTSAARLTFKT
jgi:Rps23 Pro-64 3,4-dihydroxylase Tpa1-like proline 4-hydroxylase